MVLLGQKYLLALDQAAAVVAMASNLRVQLLAVVGYMVPGVEALQVQILLQAALVAKVSLFLCIIRRYSASTLL